MTLQHKSTSKEFLLHGYISSTNGHIFHANCRKQHENEWMKMTTKCPNSGSLDCVCSIREGCVGNMGSSALLMWLSSQSHIWGTLKAGGEKILA